MLIGVLVTGKKVVVLYLHRPFAEFGKLGEKLEDGVTTPAVASDWTPACGMPQCVLCDQLSQRGHIPRREGLMSFSV